MKIIKGYHNFYLKCDVLLLGGVFEKIRNSNLRHELCLSYYLSTPALSWDAKLNMTKVDLEFISDTDMYLFFEKGMRGGVSYISEDIAKPTISI